MMVPNYEKLFEPYTADGATLEGTLKWLKKTSNASEMVIGQVLSETMLKLAEGYEFDRKKCHCGCGLTNAHTSIEHYMLAQVKALEEKGFIEKDDTPRGIKPLQKIQEKLQAKTSSLPLLGFIPAGGPIMTDEYVQAWMDIGADNIKDQK